VKPRFSERIGAVVGKNALQLQEMSEALRNSIWNLIVETLYAEQRRAVPAQVTATIGVPRRMRAAPPQGPWSRQRVSRFLCQYFFKQQVDLVPQNDRGALPWLRERFFADDSEWHHAYDLLEFVGEHVEKMGFGESKESFLDRANQMLEEECSGYRFVAGVLVPVTNTVEMESIETAIHQASCAGISGAAEHLSTAMSHLAKRPQPDYRNSIKESISAIEAVTKTLTGVKGGGLDQAMKALESKAPFHGGFRSGVLSLYGYTSDEDGIRHAILEEPNIGFDEAKFMLVACSGFVNFLISKADRAGLLRK